MMPCWISPAMTTRLRPSCCRCVNGACNWTRSVPRHTNSARVYVRAAVCACRLVLMRVSTLVGISCLAGLVLTRRTCCPPLARVPCCTTRVYSLHSAPIASWSLCWARGERLTACVGSVMCCNRGMLVGRYTTATSVLCAYCYHQLPTKERSACVDCIVHTCTRARVQVACRVGSHTRDFPVAQLRAGVFRN